ncbi:MAG TPA: hypothetical protein VKY85_18215 [Candidatus Angelobacter sp.]|nr:hypothetical protein [Candidatus Angelobacter sp.]
MSASSFGIHYIFPHNYEVKVLESYSLVNPAEKLHQFPAQLEAQDRNGVYLRVTSQTGPTWIGFFGLGFDSPQVASGVYSCPDSNSLCAVVGGYAYVVDVRDPQSWMQIEQRPVVEVKPVPELKLLLFVGFTSIAGLGESGQPWTTERLSWEGLSITGIQGTTLHGLGWDVIADKEVPFEVDLRAGNSKGGGRPGR